MSCSATPGSNVRRARRIHFPVPIQCRLCDSTNSEAIEARSAATMSAYFAIVHPGVGCRPICRKARKGKKSEGLGEHQNEVSQPESGLAYLPKGHYGQVHPGLLPNGRANRRAASGTSAWRAELDLMSSPSAPPRRAVLTGLSAEPHAPRGTRTCRALRLREGLRTSRCRYPLQASSREHV